MTSNDEKAKRYISSLDAARCDGSWTELPELIRKVAKHAPERKCLIQTATAETDVARVVSLRSASPSSLNKQIPQLASAVVTENPSTEDRLQAQTCSGWIHWILGEPENAISQLPKEPDLIIYDQSRKPGPTYSPWTEICLVKAAYIRGTALGRMGKNLEALETFKPIRLWMDDSRYKAVTQPQLAYWVEQSLAQLALLCTKVIDFRKPDSSRISESLHSFRSLAKFSSKGKEVTPAKYGNSSAHISRLSMWSADYRFLSNMLKYALPYPTDQLDSGQSNQVAELRRVEVMYENELLRVTEFPKATDSNIIIENWVEQVVENWQLLCRQGRSSGMLDEVAQNVFGRNVLEILYRASAKTFHSTLILRRLFQVHKSLAEFDLAYKALDTYIELIERARARAAKSDEPETGQEKDELVLRTIAEGIEGLCAFGGQSEAEKAHRLSEKLEKWVKPLLPDLSESPTANGHSEGNMDGLPEEHNVISAETHEVVFRAIGIGKAHWAKWTPFNETRGELQAEAVSSLRRAIERISGNEHRLRSLYAFALLLAEMRNVNQAIDYVKQALVSQGSAVDESGQFSVQRNLIPLWHLLALLLTARQDFETAGQTCAAAFEQFTSSEILFGTKRSKLLSSNASTEKSLLKGSHEPGLVDDMECSELQRIIEIRITELALTEAFGGPEDAVNRSNELLSLYFRLFGRLGGSVEDKPGQKTVEPPKSSATTVRSFRGSVFGRRKIDPLDQSNEKAAASEVALSRPTTQATEAPTIQVTDEHGRSPSHKHHIFRMSEDRQSRSSATGHKREGSFSKLIRSHSKERRSEHPKAEESSPSQTLKTAVERKSPNHATVSNSASAAGDGNRLEPQHTTDEVPVPPSSLTSHSAPAAKQGAQSSASGTYTNGVKSSSSTDPNQEALEDAGDLQSADLPSVFEFTPPMPRFSKTVSQKHALGLLAKIWLVIATLYRRAHHFDDAREACDEAAKAAQKIETLVAGEESSARAFADPGWGGIGKSSDEVWADVFYERAELALAVAYTSGGKPSTGEEIDSERVREAVEHFEQCLMFFPNHAKGIVGLSNVLLDSYEKKVELGRKVDDGKPKEDGKEKMKRSADKVSNAMQNGIATPAASSDASTSGNNTSTAPSTTSSTQTDDELRKTPENLNRLAARDRAYGLLSTLTKLGTGWDDSEAWFALARAHELGGEIQKSKEILWWCVELEDRRPIRAWRNIGCMGYVL